MARRWVWSFWEEAVGSLSEARTAVSSAKVAMVESGEVGMCVFYRCSGNNVSTELFPSNGCFTVAGLHRCYSTVGLHVIMSPTYT
jgi:hypothetical protein